MSETTRVNVLAAEMAAAADGRVVVDVQTAADLLGVCRATIRRAIGAGRLTASRTGGARGPLRIRVRDLAGWFAAGEDAAVPMAPAPVRRRAARTAAAAR